MLPAQKYSKTLYDFLVSCLDFKGAVGYDGCGQSIPACKIFATGRRTWGEIVGELPVGIIRVIPQKESGKVL